MTFIGAIDDLLPKYLVVSGGSTLINTREFPSGTRLGCSVAIIRREMSARLFPALLKA